MGFQYTGCDPNFCISTTSKLVMKKEMIEQGVATTSYVEIRKDYIEFDVKAAIEIVGFPMFVKLSAS